MFKKIIFAFLLGILLLPTTIYAEDASLTEDTSELNSSDQGLSVSPPLRELTVKPGDSVKLSIKLSNPTKSVLNIYPVVMDFTSKDDTGDPLFLNTSEKSRTYSLSSWINFSQTKITIAPEQIVDWEYVVAVPSDGGPGGHYGSIMFSSKPPSELDGTNQVGISSMVASLVLINVPGDIKENAFADFSSDKNFYFKPPVELITKITNTGNTHIVPTGDIVIKNMLGKKVSSISLNELKGRILPEGSRKFATKWEPSTTPFWKSPIGRYTVSLTSIFGREQTYALDSTISFWIIPIWFITTLSILLIAIITLVIVLIKRKRNALLN